MPGLLRMVRRGAVTVVGATVLVAGLLMLVLPGPGLLGTAAGLAILATEYAWARKHVHHVRRRAHDVTALAGASPLNTAVAIGFGAVLLTVGTVAVVAPDLIPLVGVGVGVGLLLSGTAIVVGTVVGYRERLLALRLRREAERHGMTLGAPSQLSEER